MYESKKQYHYGTGRRKSSIARVRVYENGTGSIIINGREIDDYFGLDTLKLIVQPILENAIYHGMSAAEDEGVISVRAYRRGDDLFIDVEDNGLGMRPEVAEQLLEEHRPAINTKGSGIGVRNVHQRIQLTFGRQYGLTIQSEPDEGTLVRIHLPALDEEASRPYRKEADS